MSWKLLAAAVVGAVLVAHPAFAAEVVVQMSLVSEQGVGAGVGTVTISESPNGLVLTPKLAGLPPGPHGFHVHQNPDCSPVVKDGKTTAALAAGGHYDPAATGKHEGPAGTGHLGDLPVLTVAADGTASAAVTAPRLKLADVMNRSLMIHAAGDNFADQPAPLGGGGARIACGVIR